MIEMGRKNKKKQGEKKIPLDGTSSTIIDATHLPNAEATGQILPTFDDEHFESSEDDKDIHITRDFSSVPITGLFPIGLPSEEALLADLPPSIPSIIDDQPNSFHVTNHVQSWLHEHEYPSQDIQEG